MSEKPVNQIDIDSNIIKANDINSVINIKINDVNDNPVNLENEIEYFYLVRNNKYYPVTDISFNNEGISFKLPNLYKGLYKIEIKDKKGSIYPANDNVSIILNQSFESGKESEFINMKDSILKDVPDILNDYITENEDKLKGKDGKDGIDGKDGTNGRHGIDGRDGEDGRDGVNGIDGKDGKDGIDGKDGAVNFDEITEEQLNLLKGDPGEKGDTGEKGEKGDPGVKGDPGEKGEDGGFNGETIGINNLIDITKLIPRGSTATYDYDLEIGRVNYSNIEWYLSQYIQLKGVKHSFRVQDYLINPNYGVGKMILHILDSENNIVVNNVSVEKGKPISIDLSGREDQTYWVQLRVTNTALFSGFIEKPMLVEGEYTSNWNLSEEDRIILQSNKNYHDYRLFTSRIEPATETQLGLYLQGTKVLTNNGLQFTLTQGTWLINWNFYLNLNNESCTLRIYKNDTEVYRSVARDNYFNVGLMVSTKNGDTLHFTVENKTENAMIMYADIRNNLQLKKI